MRASAVVMQGWTCSSKTLQTGCAPGMDEQVVLVDSDDREIGQEDKLAAHQRGVLHRAFSVFVLDDRGRMLLQRRAPDKYHSGGLWSNACCGHPRPGEAVGEGARRRLREEMGFDCPLEPAFVFTYEADVGSGLCEHEVDHVLIGRFNGRPTPDPAEADAWRWATVTDLARDVLHEPDHYTAWFKIAFERLRLSGSGEGR